MCLKYVMQEHTQTDNAGNVDENEQMVKWYTYIIMTSINVLVPDK